MEARDFGLSSIDFISGTSPCSPWSSSSSPAQILSVWLPPRILLAIRLASKCTCRLLEKDSSSYANDCLATSLPAASPSETATRMSSPQPRTTTTQVGSPIAGDQERRSYHLLEGFDVPLPP